MSTRRIQWYRTIAADGPGAERIRFALVGAFNTAFGFGVFAGLHSALAPEVHYVGVLLIAHVVSVLVAFVGHRTVVFRVRGHVLRDLFRFWLVYLGVLLVNLAALPLLVEGLGIPVILAQGSFVVGTVIASYVAHKSFSFRRPLAPDDPGH